MPWFAWLGIAVLVTGLAAVSGLAPKGGRPVANTRLMGMARLILWAIALLIAYVAFRTYSGG